MHATDFILCSFLCPMVTKARFNFQANPISSFREKVEQTDKSDDGEAKLYIAGKLEIL